MSPAFPAIWLLWGLTFAMGIAYFLSLPWPKIATITVYSLPIAWYLTVARIRIGLPLNLNKIDTGFTLFIVIVLMSATTFPGPDNHGAVWKYLRFVPFLMVTPYVIGRMMSLKDLEKLSYMAIFSGLVILPMLLIDHFIVIERPSRLPIFGLDHGPLLAGKVLTIALLATYTIFLSTLVSRKEMARLMKIVFLIFIGCFSILLVWVMARGWVLAGLASIVLVTSSVRGGKPILRFALATYVFSVISLTIFLMPTSSFYTTILNTSPVLASPIPTAKDTCPILGTSVCQPFQESVNSVAIRWVMYREAAAIFIENPLWGIGAGRFGDCSCTGPGWYPHNIVLQGFAELGLLGGSLQLGLFILATITLLKPLILMKYSGHLSAYSFALALFTVFFVSNQFYGTYFMATGTWLLVGVAARLRSETKERTPHV